MICSVSVTTLVATSGNESSRMPYHSHSIDPTARIANMPHEISYADRVRRMRTTCGTNAMVVRAPASKPNASWLESQPLTGCQVRGELH